VAEDEHELPAWSLPSGAESRIDRAVVWPFEVTRNWAWGGSSGDGVRVCIVDSGIDASHPLVGEVARAVAVVVDEDRNATVVDDEEGDVSGHGTACAGIVRSLAPGCELASCRVLGPDTTGSGPALLAGLRWALDEGYRIVNLSLSTRKPDLAWKLRELADRAYFAGAAIVASAHNVSVESYPWRFASVVSVGSHEQPDPALFFYNTSPPVEFFARGVNVEIAWLDGASIRATGNSFATPHIAGHCALVLGKHPELTPFELKTILYLTASNVGGER
jgi:subtilisin family serine protease